MVTERRCAARAVRCDIAGVFLRPAASGCAAVREGSRSHHQRGPRAARPATIRGGAAPPLVPPPRRLSAGPLGGPRLRGPLVRERRLPGQGVRAAGGGACGGGRPGPAPHALARAAEALGAGGDRGRGRALRRGGGPLAVEPGQDGARWSTGWPREGWRPPGSTSCSARRTRSGSAWPGWPRWSARRASRPAAPRRRGSSTRSGRRPWAAATTGRRSSTPPSGSPTRWSALATCSLGFMFLSPGDAPPGDLAARVDRLRFFWTAAGARGPGRRAGPGAGRRPAGPLRRGGDAGPGAPLGGRLGRLPHRAAGPRRHHPSLPGGGGAGGAILPSLGLALVARVEGRGGAPAPIVPVGAAGAPESLVEVRVGSRVVPTDDAGRVGLDYAARSATSRPGRPPTCCTAGSRPRSCGAGSPWSAPPPSAPGTSGSRPSTRPPRASSPTPPSWRTSCQGEPLQRTSAVLVGELLLLLALAVGLARLFARGSSRVSVAALVLGVAGWTALAALALRHHLAARAGAAGGADAGHLRRGHHLALRPRGAGEASRAGDLRPVPGALGGGGGAGAARARCGWAGRSAS